MSWFGFGGDKKDKTKEKAPCSPNDYVAEKLQKIDADHFAAAGILVVHSNGPASLEMLLGRSSAKNELEFLGGKRDAGEDVYTTAAREFDEETGGVLNEIKKDLTHRQMLMKACKESPVLWYSRGRYALFLVSAAKLQNLVWFEASSDSLPKRHRAFMQSGKAKSKSSSFQEMQELMWMPFVNPSLPHGQKARDFMRSVFECAVFKVWLHANIYGQRPHTLHVSGLDWSTKKDDIKAIFEVVGPCKITLEPHDDSSSPHKTNGKGTVVFDDRHHATTAVYLFHKSTYGGRALSVTWAQDQGQPSAASVIAAGGGSALPPAHMTSALPPAQMTSAAAPSHIPGFQPAYTGMRGQPPVASAAPASYVPPPPLPGPTADGPLPVGWIQQLSPTGTPFYVHPSTNYTTWDRPPGPPPMPAPSHAAPPPMPAPSSSSYSHAPPPPSHSHAPPPPPPHSSFTSPAPPPTFLDRGAPPPPAAYTPHYGAAPPPQPPPAYPPPMSGGYAQHPPPAY